VATDDSSAQEAATLAAEVEKLNENEEFLLGLKKKLESENKDLVGSNSELASAKDELSEKISKLMASEENLRDDVRGLERKLSDAKDDLVRAGSMAKAKENLQAVAEEKVDQSENDAIIEWARRNTTLVFPIVLKALQPIVLQDRGQQVKIPIQVGGSIRASRFHPTAPGFLVVSQTNSDKFLATTPISSTNFVEMVRPKYDGQSNKMGSGGNPLYVAPKRQVASTPESKPQQSNAVLTPASSSSPLGSAPILTGRAMNPQKPANLLDQLPTSTKPESDENDHGSNCVCPDCRKKKAGMGGSLFPDL